MSTKTAAAVPPGGGMTVISRLERIDLMLLCLEEIKAGGGGGSSRKSSCLSAASSGGEGLMTVTDGGNSSESSLSEKKKEHRNMEEVIVETQIKGSLIDRIIFLESRLLKMDLQNTAFSVQLGRSARIQLENAIIETRNTGATIQFGSVDFPTITVRTSVVFMHDMNSEEPARRPRPAETSAHRAHLSAPRATTAQDPRRRIYVFERISQYEAPTTKRIVTCGRIFVVTANTTTLPTGMYAPVKSNVEASSSRGRLIRRQRIKMNVELRAQQ
ncbi:hypothetical protein M5K25_008795 [Dendrobium thyrsiflorum]|uniref:Uncharacterized protein n=1 Tax=Dendrobium thyrsiflorum TaxID=117978 RepID=A0ABD0VA61_DENTH